MTRAISWLRQQLPFSRRAAIAAAVVPRRFWFRFALRASRWQGRVVGALGQNGRLTESLMRDHWFHELTSHGPFDIPMRIHGRDMLERHLSRGPVFYCALHLAMSEMPLRCVLDMGYPVPVPVAANGRTLDGEFCPVIGTRASIPALSAGPYALARMRTLLQKGTSIACLADRNYMDAEFNSNPMRLAGRMGVPVLFALGAMGTDGVVDVTFEEAPHLYCKTEAEIEENLNALREKRNGILRLLDALPPQPETLRQTVPVLTSSPDETADSGVA